MRALLESIRFAFLFFILSAILSVITYWILSISGLNTSHYDWIVLIGVLMVMFALYRIKGWHNAFNKQALWLSVTLIVLLLLLIPAFSPTTIQTSKLAYSYGFPFKFLTIYSEGGSKFFMPHLFSGGYNDWNLNIGLLLNFIFFYFCVDITLKDRRKQRKNVLNKAN